MKRTNLTRGVAVAMSALLLAGCSAGSDRGSASDLQLTGEISGELEIQYFVGGYGGEWWKQAFEDFTREHPDVTIVENSSATINEEMRSRWISNDPPDIVLFDGAGISESQMVKDMQLLNITEWIQEVESADGTPLVERFIVPPNTYDGEVYSLPLIYDNRGVWYDAAWFAENGWEVPSDVDSWTASMDQIKTEAGIAPIGTTGVYPNVFLTGVMYPAFANAGGGELLNALVDGEEGSWTDPRVLEVMRIIEGWVSAGYVDEGFASLTHTQAQVNFLNHGHAYVPTGFWLPNEMSGEIPDDFEFGVIPTPFNQPGEPMAIVPDVKTIAVAENAKNPEAALAFLDFLMTDERAAEFAKLSGGMLNLRGIDFETDEGVPDYLKQANELLSDEERTELVYLNHPMHADLSTSIGNAIVGLLLGDLTAEQFISAAEAAAMQFRS